MIIVNAIKIISIPLPLKILIEPCFRQGCTLKSFTLGSTTEVNCKIK